MTSSNPGQPSASATANGGAITVSVKLFADLRKYLPKGGPDPFTVSLSAGATVAAVIAALGIPGDYELTAGVNDELARRDTVLRDGDALMLLSPMEGG
jgi:molybdopterin converting factor small subunit